MKFKMVHENYNVSDLGKSMAFYEKALGLREVRRINGNGFIIVYIGNDESDFVLELTWLEDHPQPYDLGECAKTHRHSEPVRTLAWESRG